VRRMEASSSSTDCQPFSRAARLTDNRGRSAYVSPSRKQRDISAQIALLFGFICGVRHRQDIRCHATIAFQNLEVLCVRIRRFTKACIGMPPLGGRLHAACGRDRSAKSAVAFCSDGRSVGDPCGQRAIRYPDQKAALIGSDWRRRHVASLQICDEVNRGRRIGKTCCAGRRGSPDHPDGNRSDGQRRRLRGARCAQYRRGDDDPGKVPRYPRGLRGNPRTWTSEWNGSWARHCRALAADSLDHDVRCSES